jgi:hypothetical protein
MGVKLKPDELYTLAGRWALQWMTKEAKDASHIHEKQASFMDKSSGRSMHQQIVDVTPHTDGKAPFIDKIVAIA